ncbi:MAG: hypothetical protein CMP59_04440 [Flavobacteriales bacterium]|nr:hypothetical protein [Flavobacteriales bacterium]
MCGRYVIVSSVKTIAEKFQVQANIDFTSNFNIAAGQRAPIITSENPEELSLSHFGFTPFWAKKRTYVINARAEGDHNKENDPNYTASKGIIKKPFFRAAIRSKRCLIPADAFIEGTTKEKLDKPYLVYMENGERPFAFAGIYDEWIDKESGEVYPNFAIITCRPNPLLQKIPHHRMPVILDERNYREWLNKETALSEVTSLLEPYDHRKMNAYPLDPEIKRVKTNSREALKAIGQPLVEKQTFSIENSLELLGMGESKARSRK